MIEVDLRLSIPDDNLRFNKVTCITHRYVILTSNVGEFKFKLCRTLTVLTLSHGSSGSNFDSGCL